jgi:hypothetical protein
VNEVGGRFNYEWLAQALVVFFAFILFLAARELRRGLGKGIIKNLFFQTRSDPEMGVAQQGRLLGKC